MQLDIDKFRKKKRLALFVAWAGVVVTLVGIGFLPHGIPAVIVGMLMVMKGIKDRERVVVSLKEELFKDKLNELIEEGYYTAKRKLPKEGKKARNPLFRLIVMVLKLPLHALKLLWILRFQGGPAGVHKHFRVKAMTRTHGLTPKEVLNSDFIPMDKAFQSKDFIRGKLHGVHFKASDVRCMRVRTETTRSMGGRKSKSRTVIRSSFHGRIFIFDFNKPIDGRVLALEKFRPLNKSIYRDVETESIDFNKKFSIFATDPQLAYYVLTPHKMEAIMELEEMHPGQIGFAFIKNRLYVALNTGRDSFPIDKRLRFVDSTLVSSFRKDLERLGKIIDRLKLDNDMFKQEVDITDADFFAEKDELVQDDAALAEKIVAKMDVEMPMTRKDRPRLFHTEYSRAFYDAHVSNLEKEDWEAFDGHFEKAKQKRLKRFKR